MFKTYDKAKKVPTWDKPRILNTVIDDFYSTIEKLDEQSRKLLDWAVYFGYLLYKVDFSESLNGLNMGSKTVKSKKTDEDKFIYHHS